MSREKGQDVTRKASSPAPGGRPVPTAPRPSRWTAFLAPIAVLVVFLAVVVPPVFALDSHGRDLGYSELLTAVDEHRVKSLTLHPDGEGTGRMVDDTPFTTAVPAQAGPALLHRLTAAGVRIGATTRDSSGGWQDMSWLFILGAIVLFGLGGARRVERTSGVAGWKPRHG